MGLCLGKHAGKQTVNKELAIKEATHTAEETYVNTCTDSERPASCVIGSDCSPEQQATTRRCACAGPAVVEGSVASHTGVHPLHPAQKCGSALHVTSGSMSARGPMPSAAVSNTSAAAPAAGNAAPVQLSVTSPASEDMGVRPTSDSWCPAGTTSQPVQTSASAQTNKQQVTCNAASRCVTFADLGPDSTGQLALLRQCVRSMSTGKGVNHNRNGLPRRSKSSAAQGSISNGEGQLCAAIAAKRAAFIRSSKIKKLQQRRGGLDSSFQALQDALEQSEKPLAHVNTRAAGLKHIGFGPFKRENQDDFFIQVGGFGGQHSSNLFCVFDGHGSHGKDAALYSKQLLPRLLDIEVTKYLQVVDAESDQGLKGAVEMLITEVFGETERSISKSGVNLASSGTTASVAYQQGNRLWVASAGDSRVILCSRKVHSDQWQAAPLTLDHRPRRLSERERVEAAGARVAPKRLPSGQLVGEPRLWLQNAHGPGLMLSRSLGDLTAATVGCTSDPEVSFTTLRPGVDHMLVMATDGIWDVLSNEQVCDIVVESPDPHLACRRVLDAALYEWEERMSADNITVLVVEFEWGQEGYSAASMGQGSAAGNAIKLTQDTCVSCSDADAAVTAVTPAVV